MRCQHQQTCQQHQGESRVTKEKTFFQALYSRCFLDRLFRGRHEKNDKNEEQRYQYSGDWYHFDPEFFSQHANHKCQKRIQTRPNPSGYAKIDIFSRVAVIKISAVDEWHHGIPQQDQQTHKHSASPGSRYEGHDNADHQVGYGQHQDHIAPGKAAAPVSDSSQQRLKQGCKDAKKCRHSANFRISQATTLKIQRDEAGGYTK